ncbi:MAG TPA: restriction endonuclease, SacI family [Bryobacteraceae bacterium]|jgi:hypothetical protein|nr:restriction endonuclease, SacI family [Bryobacteraceae bacterium]
MPRSLDYRAAAILLETSFAGAEVDFASDQPPLMPPALIRATELLMRSATQAYREVLIGCCIARCLDPQIDVHLPYANQGDSAYNGRSLDETVVNPFLQAHEIPASRGPFLSVFRRSVAFRPDTRGGLRDKAGFDALLSFIDALAEADPAAAQDYLRHLLYAFVRLRDASNIALLHVQRLSLEQYETLLEGLLQVPSGGRFPVILTLAMFQTIREAFSLDWQIDYQGINVSDRASEAGGDITIRSGDTAILAVEVTDRPIDRARVEATFNNKVLRHNLTDYLFFHGEAVPGAEARALARRYFGQGHDMNFLSVKQWLIDALAIVGSRYRPRFTANLLESLRGKDIPAAMRLAWNGKVRELLDT